MLLQPGLFALARPERFAAAYKAPASDKLPDRPDGLESSPVPAGLKSVDAEQGSLAYQSPFQLRDRLVAAGVELTGLRHGESEANAAANEGKPVLTGQSETPLTAKGHQQARAAAEQLLQQLGGDAWLQEAMQKPELLPVVYASPLSRASETAAAFANLLRERSLALGQALELPIRKDPRLLEMSFGSYEGKPASRLMREHPVFAANWDGHRGAGVDFQHRFPQGESRLDVIARVSSLLQEVVEQHAGRRVLLVCHQETLVGVRTALGLSKQRDGRIRADSGQIQNATPIALVSRGTL
ncbi:histidine phosphatase family protein [bacterium]|nr:histidine phosphatase family protein [bacterium]